MKSSKKRLLLLASIFAFFISVPFLQSFLFVKESKGRISINKVVEADYLRSEQKIVLLFFGYVGCKDVCSPFLHRLHTFYQSMEFNQFRDDVEVVFVNLTPQVEAFQADLFAKFFDENFRGIYLSRRELLSVDRNFGLFFSDDLSDETLLNHTDYLYLIDNTQKNKVLKSMYAIHPLNTQKLQEDIMKLKNLYKAVQN